MIQKLFVQNYRCLREVELTLGPLTALVGPNASGKTTVLDVLRSQHRMQPEDVWRRGGGGVVLRLVIDGRPRGETFTAPAVIRWEYTYQLLRLDLNALRSENQVAAAPSLGTNGGNLANVLATLGRVRQAALAAELCRLVPMFRDVDLRPTESGKHELRFYDRWDPKLEYRPGQVSDGTMLLLAYLTTQYQQDPPDLLAIEEPERGLHPYLLGELVSFFRKLSRAELGLKPVQIVLATHSSELLEFLQPDEVRFLSRREEDGSVEVSTVDPTSPDWQHYFDEYRRSLGSAWLSGGLGGVPGG